MSLRTSGALIGFALLTVGYLVALIWADYNDGLWRLKINGEIQPFESAPARLRGFQARPGDQVEMSYLGPLSGLWRR